ncbi:winged helix-turn-helix transcriptional regulator [Corynebacterium uberis]|uniref:winged helix-turn-helix transcriptional regulator n=1 Tax=Corynebacterium TaxID=1716 RepID=UPI001D0BDBAF|nr:MULTISPECIES: helix-turn-helix domain-containing protein [Corynebacterium]MCZ9309671.1 helix-turn-helix transcriptional regulator [Corynebacterium sp. c6VSa_13]UDL73475.1 helix-turn-helix transcriptional regulator [Corynebacterium uberis]UDL75645.1 helix-turn-helix transcriptional regulator [Corynebacterium uberis]UDL77858.1 helix-turn-helix transcriptional regulator [Corynebacterium uberis]UDL80141.1 helix-turn-helix transcriptional regulator [Corynebacterium uberis]
MPLNSTDHPLPACPVEVTLRAIGTSWKILILRELLGGHQLRFGELKERVTGISPKMLTANLRAMEADGLLTRTAHPTIPPRVDYQLTELGESLAPVLDAMKKWGSAIPATAHTA